MNEFGNRQHPATNERTRPGQRVFLANLSFRHAPVMLLFCVLVITSLIRIHFLSVPFERDEGEYAYTGQLILQGVPPFAQTYNMKLPGTYGVYAAIMALFGQTVSGVHLGLLIANSLSVLLLYGIGRRLYSSFVGCVAGVCFAVTSLSRTVLGLFANSEHFVVLSVLAGILILLHALESPNPLKLFSSGLFMGIGFVLKQHGMSFVAFGVVVLIFQASMEPGHRWKAFCKALGWYSAGALIPFVAVCLVMWGMGVFGAFWFWTFSYAQKYVSLVSLNDGFHSFYDAVSDIIRVSVPVWVCAAVGAASVFDSKIGRMKRFFAVSFVVFGFLAICPGFYFREHYFILLLPAVALLSGIGVEYLLRQVVRGQPATTDFPLGGIAAVLAIALFSLYMERTYYFRLTPRQVCRATYHANPFPESIEIARYVEEHSSSEDRVAVIGSEPQIYFYSHRRAATGYLYMYALMENQAFALKMQKEMIHEIEQCGPKYLVFVNVPMSWLLNRHSGKQVFDWFENYQKNYYRSVGVIDILSPDSTYYVWGHAAETYAARSRSWLAVFERRS